MNNTKYTFVFKENAFRSFVLVLLRFFVHLVARVEVIHPEFSQKDGRVMFAANHISGLDAVIMQVVIPRPLCFMSKAELFENPLFGWILNQLGSFPVKRGEFDRQSILNARGVLESGYTLMMFPEGTRTFGEGMVEARSGTAHLAMRNNCMIVPAALSGAENVLKAGLKRADVKIVFGPPIYPGERENAAQLTERIMRSIAQELPEKYRGYYA